MECVSGFQAIGGYGQQALPQEDQEQRLEKEFFRPARKIQEILETGNKVKVNHAFYCTTSVDNLSRFLIRNNATVHTYSYFSTPRSMKFNCRLTTSEELNSIKVKKLFTSSEVRFLSLLIDQEVDASIHESLRIVHAMVEKESQELQELELLSQAKDKETKTFTCRHLSLAYICNIIKVENIKILEYFSTSRHDETSLNAVYDRLENMADFLSYNTDRRLRINFNKNMTIDDLIYCQKELNSMGFHALDDAIKQTLELVRGQPGHQKINKRPYILTKVLKSHMLAETNPEKHKQMDKERYYLCYFGASLYPIRKIYLEGVAYQVGLVLSCFSINTFMEFMREACQDIYHNKPINYEVKYLIETLDHMMGLKIKRENDGVIINFYDPNSGREKIICITHGDYAQEITISDFFTKARLVKYGILLADNYELSTILCSRVCSRSF